MRLLALFLSLLLTCQLSFIGLPATASAVYDANAGISGEAPVNKVGTLLLASSLAMMSGSTIQISAKGQNGSNELSGQIFKTSKASDQVSGYAYFGLGSELAKLDAVRCNEYVDKVDGTRVNGPVSDVNERSVTCAGQTIPMGSVVAIHSARVFKFILKTGEHPRLEFTPTCVKMVAAAHRSRLTKIVIATVVLAGIACAIALPIALSGHHHHNNSLANYYALKQYYANQTASQPTVAPPPPVITTTTTTVVLPQTPPPPPPTTGGSGFTGGGSLTP